MAWAACFSEPFDLVGDALVDVGEAEGLDWAAARVEVTTAEVDESETVATPCST